MPYAASFANHFAARLVVLHVLPAAPVLETFHWSTTGDLTEMRREAELAATEDGIIHFYDDIYGHDAALEKVLAKGYPYPS